MAVREKLEEYRFKKAALLWPFRRSRIEHLVFLPERANKTKNPNNPVNPVNPVCPACPACPVGGTHRTGVEYLPCEMFTPWNAKLIPLGLSLFLRGEVHSSGVAPADSTGVRLPLYEKVTRDQHAK